MEKRKINEEESGEDKLDIGAIIEQLGSTALDEIDFKYILKYKDEKGNNCFQIKGLNINKVREKVKDTIKTRMQKLNEELDNGKLELQDFDFSMQLGNEQIGVLGNKNFPEDLKKVLERLDGADAKITNKDKKNENAIGYVIRIGKVMVFKKIPFYKLLKGRTGYSLGLKIGSVVDIGQGSMLVVSPDDFDALVVDGTALIFSESNFNFLFAETTKLMDNLENERKTIGEIVTDSEALLDYLRRYPSTVRGFYYKVAQRSLTKFDKNFIEDVNKRMKKNLMLDEDGKVVCVQSNAKDVYRLIMGKFAEKLLNGKSIPIVVISESSNV